MQEANAGIPSKEGGVDEEQSRNPLPAYFR
jgi:hypothetical protein